MSRHSEAFETHTDLPALRRPPLLPERSDFLEGDAPPADKVADFLARALPAAGNGPTTAAEALVPWVCYVLLSEHSVKAYGRDLVDFLRQRTPTASDR